MQVLNFICNIVANSIIGLIVMYVLFAGVWSMYHFGLAMTIPPLDLMIHLMEGHPLWEVQ